MQKKDIIREIKKKNLPVLVCGAGVVGEVILNILRTEGIEVQAFCDSSKKVIQADFCNLKVHYTPNLRTKFENAIIIISVAAIKDVVDLLESQGFSNWYAGGLLLKELDISQDESDASLDYTKFAIENCILCHDGYLAPDKLFFRSIDLIITERCTLRCKDCSNLMQYYEKPQNCDTKMLLESIDSFCSVIDEVMDFRIIGGEAFVNKDWPVIIERLINEPKAKRIVIYSNGTILPDAKYFPLLQNEKVLLIVTDYGELSRKLKELKPILEENKIAHHILMITEWLDCSSIEPHNRSIDELKELYKYCCAKNMVTLSDGKLFRCPYAANAARLSAVPDYKEDYIDLFQESMDEKNIRNTKAKVKDYLLYKEYMRICDFCAGRPLSGPEVIPAVQAKKPLEYVKYSR